MRFSAACLSSSLTRPRATWREIFWLIVATAFWSASALMSEICTSYPASAQTWAIPLPIWPAPMMPTVRIEFEVASVMACPTLLARCSAIGQLLGQLRLERGHDLEQIADETVIRDLEDGRFLVFVDGDDDFRVFHAGEMLNG